MLRKYALFRVVGALLKNPRKAYTLGGMADDAGVSVSTSKGCLDYLVKKGVVGKAKSGWIHMFSLNNDFPVTRHMKILALVMDVTYSGLLDEIISKSSPSSVLLYGSGARGDYDERSDVDMLIISDKKKKFITDSKISREVNYQIYTLNEWREKARKDKVFYDRVILDGICLYGEKPVVL